MPKVLYKLPKMASSQKRETKTPEVLPWIPSQQKKSFNILSEKKNSKQELPEFGKSNANEIFGGKNKKVRSFFRY